MKAYGGVDVEFHVFLISELVKGEWSDSRPGRFTLGERAHGTHWIGGWVCARAGLDYVQKRTFLTLPVLELRPLCHSQSLYGLRSPGAQQVKSFFVPFRLQWFSIFLEPADPLAAHSTLKYPFPPHGQVTNM
jgi:hypothetical protein